MRTIYRPVVKSILDSLTPEGKAELMKNENIKDDRYYYAYMTGAMEAICKMLMKPDVQVLD